MQVVAFLILGLVAAECRAVRPYTPVHPDPALEPWRWRSFPELKGKGLRCMAEDRDGRMWFDVNDGVCVYDAVKWTTYTEADGVYGLPVRSLCAGRDGSMYVGTLQGICRWKDGEWGRVFPKQHGVPWHLDDIVQAPDGSLWAGIRFGLLHLTRNGAEVYAIEDWEPFLRTVVPEARVHTIPREAVPVLDRSMGFVTNNTMGVGVGGDGVIVILAPGGPGEKAGLLLGDRIVAVDGRPNAGTTWLNGTPGASVTLTVVRAGRPEPFDVTLTHAQGEWPYPRVLVHSICPGREGVLWLGAAAGGILRFETARDDSAAWRLYTEEDGLDVGFVARVLQSRDGTVWAVSRNSNQGVNRFDGKTWTHFRLRELLEGGSDLNPSILETRDGTLWIGGYSGIYACRNGVWTVYRNPDQPAPFPPIYLEMVERFIAGKPWQGRSEQTAILEVPASGYGRLRITSSDRQNFAEEDIDALKDFASAIALGYARYLDIREIQEQTERKSAFLASMSHELCTPMNAIKGFTKVVLRRGAEHLSERHQDNLNKVIQASDHLLAMINDLLDLSKIGAGRMDVNPERFDVKALVASCCATVSPLVTEKPNVVLDYDVPDDIGEVHTDQARVRQMVINLLSNAIKFTDSASVTVRSHREDDQFAIAVVDTGNDIRADEIDTIYDEYRQVKGSDWEHKGTGLGLSITKKFAELLGGSISVQSEVGVGSTFTVRIPAVYGEG